MKIMESQKAPGTARDEEELKSIVEEIDSLSARLEEIDKRLSTSEKVMYIVTKSLSNVHNKLDELEEKCGADQPFRSRKNIHKTK